MTPVVDELKKLLSDDGANIELYTALSTPAKQAVIKCHKSRSNAEKEIKEAAQKVYDALNNHYKEQFTSIIESLSLGEFTQADYDTPEAEDKCFEVANGLMIYKDTITIVGARTGRGKTYFILDLARKLKQYGKVGIIELEEGKRQIKRKIQGHAGDYLNGQITIYTPLTRDVDSLEPLFKRYRNDILIIDYVQLLRQSVLASTTSTIDQLNYVSQRLLEMTLENNVTLIEVAQFNREAGSKNTDDDDPNAMQDLSIKGCGQFEQDASLIIGLGQRKTENTRFLKIIKNRNGTNSGLYTMNINFANGDITLTETETEESPVNKSKTTKGKKKTTNSGKFF